MSYFKMEKLGELNCEGKREVNKERVGGGKITLTFKKT